MKAWEATEMYFQCCATQLYAARAADLRDPPCLMNSDTTIISRRRVNACISRYIKPDMSKTGIEKVLIDFLRIEAVSESNFRSAKRRQAALTF